MSIESELKEQPTPLEQIPENAEALKAEQVPAPIPEPTKLIFNLTKMVSITLENGTRVSFAEGTSYDNGLLNLEAFKLILQERQKQSDKIETAKA